MEYLSSYLTKRMIDNHIIAADDVEYYCYSIQIILGNSSYSIYETTIQDLYKLLEA